MSDVEKVSSGDTQDRDDYEPQIAVDSNGNSVITWEGDDGNDHEIYWAKEIPMFLSGVKFNASSIELKGLSINMSLPCCLRSVFPPEPRKNSTLETTISITMNNASAFCFNLLYPPADYLSNSRWQGINDPKKLYL